MKKKFEEKENCLDIKRKLNSFAGGISERRISC